MRTILLCVGFVLICALSAGRSAAGDIVYGCLTQPACGKVCKLVCEKKKLQSVGYGSKCDSICIPSPSRRGCKHCDMTCCQGDDLKDCPPKIEFCWYGWFACGCAKPRTVNTLTKFQAEREICSYHWEVVDAACCGCVSQNGKPASDGAIYKPAPTEAALGDVLAVSTDEWSELAPSLAPNEVASETQVAETATPGPVMEGAPATPESAPARISIAERLQGMFRK